MVLQDAQGYRQKKFTVKFDEISLMIKPVSVYVVRLKLWVIVSKLGFFKLSKTILIVPGLPPRY